MTYPTIHILPGHDRRLRSGSPWIYSNELRMDAAARALPPGSVARLVVPNGKTFALVHVNPHSLIAARVLTRNKDGRIDHRYLERRLARALALRDRLYLRPFYRLVHAEADRKANGYGCGFPFEPLLHFIECNLEINVADL